MNSEHRRPLVAFATVSCACAFVVGNATGFALPTAAPGPDGEGQLVTAASRSTGSGDSTGSSAQPAALLGSGDSVQTSYPPPMLTTSGDVRNGGSASAPSSPLQGPPLPDGSIQGTPGTVPSTVVSSAPPQDDETSSPSPEPEEPPTDVPSDPPTDDVPESDDSELTFEDLIDPEPPGDDPQSEPDTASERVIPPEETEAAPVVEQPEAQAAAESAPLELPNSESSVFDLSQ